MLITFLGEGTWILNRNRLGWWGDGAGLITFLGECTWVLNNNRLGGVRGWGWAINVPGRGHLCTESQYVGWGGGMGLGPESQ